MKIQAHHIELSHRILQYQKRGVPAHELDIKEAVEGVEIGVDRAWMSETLLTIHDGLKLHMIDPWDVYPVDHPYRETRDRRATRDRRKWVKVVREVNHRVNFAGERAVCHQGFSYDVVAKFDDASMDFVFVDGDHSEEGCAQDIGDWIKKVKPGGFIGGHDWKNPRCKVNGVEAAVHQAADAYNLELELGEGMTWWMMDLSSLWRDADS